MNTFRFVAGALLVGVLPLPALAQPELKPVNGLPFPLVSPEDAAKLNGGLKTIALHLRGASVREAMKEIARQSGVSIRTDFSDQTTWSRILSLDLETTSFTRATDAVLQQAGIDATLTEIGGLSGLRTWALLPKSALAQNIAIETPMSINGLFQMRVMSLNRSLSQNVRYARTPQRDQNDTLSITFASSPDPQLLVLGLPVLKITRAEDDQGHSLPPGRRSDFSWFSGGILNLSPTLRQTSVVLRSPEAGARKLAHLDGTALYVLASKQEKWQVSDVQNVRNLAHLFTTTRGQTTITIKSAQKTDKMLLVNLRLRLAPNEPLNSPFSNGSWPSFIQLFDAGGHRVPSNGFSSDGNDNERNAQLMFSIVPQIPRRLAPPNPAAPDVKRQGGAPAGPFKIVFDLPVEFVQTEVPFSFSNLPLP